MKAWIGDWCSRFRTGVWKSKGFVNRCPLVSRARGGPDAKLGGIARLMSDSTKHNPRKSKTPLHVSRHGMNRSGV
jgi:hypothetical protein